ncbi:MAG: hypothetical protein JXX14_03295 [Deltaproteobacteria bacterium]|nr:hypothetical protein [Deltaproteobacteria bacterium]
MKQTFLWFLLFVGLVASHSATSFAKNVAVLPTEYIDISRSTADEKASAEFHGKLLEGIQEAGYEAIEGEQVDSAVLENTTDGDCLSECLDVVRKSLTVDEVVRVRVLEDSSIGMRTMTIDFAVRQPIVDESSDGYEVVKTRLKGAVALALKDDVAGPEPQPTVSEEKSTDIPLPMEGREGETTVEVIREKPRQRLGLAPFIVSASVTAALGGTTLVVNGLAHRKFKNLESDVEADRVSKNDFDRRLETINTQQLMTGIFLVSTGVGLITTGVLALFTDFSKTNKQLAGVTPSFAFSKNSGAFFLGGNF